MILELILLFLIVITAIICAKKSKSPEEKQFVIQVHPESISRENITSFNQYPDHKQQDISNPLEDTGAPSLCPCASQQTKEQAVLNTLTPDSGMVRHVGWICSNPTVNQCIPIRSNLPGLSYKIYPTYRACKEAPENNMPSRKYPSSMLCSVDVPYKI